MAEQAGPSTTYKSGKKLTLPGTQRAPQNSAVHKSVGAHIGVAKTKSSKVNIPQHTKTDGTKRNISAAERRRRVNAIAKRHGADSAEAKRAGARLGVKHWEGQKRAADGKWSK